MKKLRVTVDGKVFEVSVEILDEGTLHAGVPAVSAAPIAPASVSAPLAPVAPPAASKPPTAGGAAGVVPSPLAGKVVSIDVKAGQAVAEGAQLLTLEAMKMNTFVYAPKAGTVAAIHVAPGDAVEESAALVTLS